jgi:G3E family GTPase
MAAIPFYLVTGFLGSGKTTFLKQIIDQNGRDKKIAIIQNEFAPANIDGTNLKDSGKPFEILEINNGSVFCVCLLSDFISSLKEFIEKEDPDIIILESSGLSDPIAISEILQSPQLKELVHLSACWCIIDVLNYDKIQTMLTRVEHQITIADFIILNKIDQASKGLLKAIKDKIHSINSLAVFLETTYCNIDIDLFYSGMKENSTTITKEKSVEESCGRPLINARVFKTSRKISLNNLKKIINLYKYQTQRIKGFVLLDDFSIASVQSVFDTVDIKVLKDKTSNTALILMGEGFNLSSFSRDFRQLT